jgi:hypothetical protein
LIELLLFRMKDPPPPILNDFNLADNILGFINILSCNIPSEYLLDLYCSIDFSGTYQ